MGHAHRLIGYLASVVSATLFYLTWFVISLELSEPPGGDTGVQFKIGFAVFFFLFSGMGAAFVLMALPWYFTVLGHSRPRFGPMYFPLVGAATTLVIGSATSSLSPKPFFVEDQTFFEGFVIAIQRQGICFLLTGCVFGLTFWLVSERLRPSRSASAS